MSPAARRWTFRAAPFVPAAVYAVLAVATFLDYGPTVDEQNLVTYGQRLVRWYATLGRDTSALEWTDHRFYGALFELLAQAAGRVSRLGLYETRHLVNAGFGLLAIASAGALGRVLGGPLAGFLSGLLLLLHPVFYGHTFNNPKDLPFAALYAAALYAGAATGLRRAGARSDVRVGLAVGAALGMRVAGLMLLPAVAALWLGLELARHKGLRTLPRVGLRVAVAAAVAWLVMVSLWPFAQVDPVRNPFRALGAFQAFHREVLNLFEGAYVRSDQLPRHYLPKWLALTWPDVYTVALPVGVACPLAVLARGGPRRRRERALSVLWLLGVTAFPVVWVVLTRPPLYDSMRHFLFVVPGLAVVGGVGLACALRALPSAGLRTAAIALLLWPTSRTVRDMVELHPYQSVYFNRWFAGGLPGAAGRYETDYWGSSYKEAVEWVVASYPGPYVKPVRVGSTSACFLTRYYLDTDALRERFIAACDDSPVPPHVMLSTTRDGRHERVPGAVVHLVSRQGVPLCYVFQVRRPQTPGAESGRPRG
jgi:hypothetical protein